MSDNNEQNAVTPVDSTRKRHIFGIPDIPEDRPSNFTLAEDPEDIVEMLSLFHPQVQNAQMTIESNGDLRFTVQAGDKGV